MLANDLTSSARASALTKFVQILLIVVTLAVLARSAFVFTTDVYSNGDSDNYVTVAENIYRNFCVSHSDPTSGACTPYWGGNQPFPGYAAFISLAWLIGGTSPVSVQLLQALVAALAIARMAYAVLVFTRRRDMAFAVGCVLAVSPLQVAFSRAILTETLATATTIWVFAELILSLAEKRLRLLSLGLALVAAIFIRTDAIVLIPVVAGVGFYLHPLPVALKRGTILGLIVAVPLGAWVARSVAVGLPPFPAPASGFGWTLPPGMMSWAMTWTENEGDERSYIIPLFQAQYSKIEVPDSAYRSAAERQEVQANLAKLASYDGQPVPADIDHAFASLAAARRHAEPLQSYVVKPLKRCLYIWLSPSYAFDWPTRRIPNLEGAAMVHAAYSSLGGLLAIIKNYPIDVAQRALINAYRLAVAIGFLVIAALSGAGPLRSLRPIIAIAGAYTLIRTLFMGAFAPGVGTRYIVETLPAMEVVCTLAVISFWHARRQAVSGHGVLSRAASGSG